MTVEQQVEAPVQHIGMAYNGEHCPAQNYVNYYNKQAYEPKNVVVYMAAQACQKLAEEQGPGNHRHTADEWTEMSSEGT